MILEVNVHRCFLCRWTWRVGWGAVAAGGEHPEKDGARLPPPCGPHGLPEHGRRGHDALSSAVPGPQELRVAALTLSNSGQQRGLPKCEGRVRKEARAVTHLLVPRARSPEGVPTPQGMRRVAGARGDRACPPRRPPHL